MSRPTGPWFHNPSMSTIDPKLTCFSVESLVICSIASSEVTNFLVVTRNLMYQAINEHNYAVSIVWCPYQGLFVDSDHSLVNEQVHFQRDITVLISTLIIYSHEHISGGAKMSFPEVRESLLSLRMTP